MLDMKGKDREAMYFRFLEELPKQKQYQGTLEKIFSKQTDG